MMIDTILPFSGGVDSTYCLWKYLKDNPNKTLLVHHVNMKNKQGRMEYEKKAVHSILEWLQNNGLGNFKFIESGFDYGNISILHHDIVIIAFTTAVILRSPQYKNVTTVIATSNKEESSGQSIEYLENTAKRKIRLKTLHNVAERNNIKVIYPIYNTPKQQLIAEMPTELFELCWYCRTPRNGKPCGNCFTCRRVNKKKI